MRGNPWYLGRTRPMSRRPYKPRNRFASFASVNFSAYAIKCALAPALAASVEWIAVIAGRWRNAMKRRLFLMLASAVVLAACSGCRTTRESCAPSCGRPPYVGPVPGIAPCDRCRQSAYPPGRIAPVPVRPGFLPATSAFPPPSSSGSFAGAGVVQQGSYSSSALLDPSGRSLLNPGVHLSAPEQIGADSVSEATRLYGAPSQEPQAAPLPSLRDDKDTSPPLAVDVPQFAVAKEGVASGLQPFPDGIAWLQAHRYRTVLHLRAPGEDDSAARRQFEKRGLRYVSLEVSPKDLSKDIVDQFSRLVTENANLPLFVYDKEGALAGGLWYLYFRTAEGTSDERARSEAIRLGFQPEQNNEHRTMWVAVQNYLRNAH
jgi:protein tyrosine phosphatase (PTP) superfamily phosphohydrolase (DUF442 family)